MKKTISYLIALLILPIALAQEIESEVNAGITPDSPFYGFDVWFDNIRANFATKTIDKARIRLEIAEERLSEMKITANQNKLIAMEKARIEEQNQITDLGNLQENLTEDEKVDVQQMLQKHVMVLESLLERVPEQAQKGIKTALENSQRVFEKNQAKISKNKKQTIDEIKKNIKAGEVYIKKSK